MSVSTTPTWANCECLLPCHTGLPRLAYTLTNRLADFISIADFVSADPEMRMHRVESKLHPVSGDVLEASSSGASTSGEQTLPQPVTATEKPGGGRIDQ